MRRLLLLTCTWLVLSFSVSAFAAQWVYIVQVGDTLWDFSVKNLKNSQHWEDLQRINSIANPKVMQPGTLIRVPLKWVKKNPVDAKVIALQGAAVLTSVNKSTQSVETGALIHLGEQLDVGPGSSLSLEFADGSVITLYEGSAVQFNHLSEYGDSGMVDTRFRLEKGRVDTRAIPAKGDGSRFEIQTPSAITAVRGTEFRTTVKEADNVSRIEVLKGKVAVKGLSKTRAIPAGYGTRVAPNQAPIAARKLLVAPTLQAIPDIIRQLNWSLRWDTLAQAQSYRIELSAYENFTGLLWDRVTVNPHTILPEIPDGQYFVRIRGIDSLGIEGFGRIAKLALDVHPRPPFLLEPADDHVFRTQVPILRWTQSSDAVNYWLQISTSENFSEELLVDKTDLTQVSYSADDLSAVGDYYWRVASISASGERGPFGPTRRLEKRAVPHVPEVAVNKEGAQLSIFIDGEEGQQYQVQISEDNIFNTLTLDQHINQQQLSLDSTATLQYMRIRIVESDGYTGPWGATQLIYPPQDSRWLQVIGLGILGILLF